MKIKYRNVGCIREADVEYKPGQLIAIVGESNQGKSLQFYSLLAGFTNTPDFKRFINNNALAENPKAYESIELIDDNGGSWMVSTSTSSMGYKVNGVKYEKVGRKSIFEITNSQIPGLLYDPENCTPIMNIVDEDTGMFPIDRSDAQIFKTYERLLSLSSTEDILRTIKLDTEDIDYNISDRMKAIQQSQVAIQKIQDFFDIVDEQLVDKSISDIESQISQYKFITELYDKTNNTANYVSAVSKVEDKALLFDLKAFQSKLEILVNANKLLQYCNKVDSAKIEPYVDFDLQKAIKLGQDLSVAIQLKQEIASLDYQIINDTSTLEGIQSILKQIKICPLCGHKMED